MPDSMCDLSIVAAKNMILYELILNKIAAIGAD